MSDWTPTPYERAVLRDARDSFKNPYRTPVSALTHALGRPEEAAELGDEATATLGAAASAGLAGLTAVAATTVRPEAVWRAYRREGIAVRSVDDVQHLELWEVDEVADRLRLKYGALALTSGAVAGTVGVTGLALDVPVAAGLAVRAILECATYYGFAIDREEEQAFAMQVFIASIVPRLDARDANLERLMAALATMLVAWKRRVKGSWGVPLAIHMLRRLLRRDSKIRLFRRAAAVAAAALNAWLLVGVIETAQAAYRRRFLARARTLAQAEARSLPGDARALRVVRAGAGNP